MKDKKEKYDEALANPNNWKPNFVGVAQDVGVIPQAASAYFKRNHKRYKITIEVVKQ